MPISGTDDALTEARVGLMRVGGSRVGYVIALLAVTIDGVTRTSLIRLNYLSIRDILNGTPNTATFRTSGFTPNEGDEVVLAFGTDPIEFRGLILSTNQIYEGKPANVAWECSCISHEWLLNRRKVTRRWTGESATVIIEDIIADYTSGFSTDHVYAALPVLDEFTVTNEDVTDCLDRVCQRIGHDWQLDYDLVLHVPAGDGLTANTITDSDDHGMAGIAVHTDLSQLKTRQSGEGGGSVAAADLAVGQTTIPVEESGWYSSSGGTVKAGPQFITYTSKSALEGTGSKIGGKTGLAPGIPTATVRSETSGNLSVGAYRYAVSFVINGGETEAGNNSSAVSITHVGDTPGMTLGQTTGGSLTLLSLYLYAITYVTAAGETSAGYGSVQLTGSNQTVQLTSIGTSSDARVTKRRIYRANGTVDGVWRLVTTINDNSTTSYDDTTADASLTPTTPPSVNTSGSGRIDLTSIPTGPTGTTARRLYRSPVNIVSNSGYKFLAAISNNSATTYDDNIADTELGDALPLTSTVGPSAGDTTLPVQDLSVFAGGGGWVFAANQLIRYTGRSASSGEGTLTGVPASGAGAITAAISYNVVVTNFPHLTGVTGILYALNRGEPVNVWVTVNDTAAQTFMAAAVGGDGIHEADPIQDRRMSEEEILARCTAKLVDLAVPLVTVRYITRDITTKSGREVTITLGAPTSISGTFLIQSVTTTNFSANGAFRPRREVECSSRRLSFEQVLRLLKAAPHVD